MLMKKLFFTVMMMIVGMTATAQDLTYEVNSYCGKSYEGYTLTIDTTAVKNAIGCSLADASAFAVQSDGKEDPAYGLGPSDGWRNADGDWMQWSSGPNFCVKADFSLDSNQIYYIGGYSGDSTPVTYTATYKLYNPEDNSKSMKIFIKLNYKEIPVVVLSEMKEITPRKNLSITQYPRNNTAATTYTFDFTDYDSFKKLGIDFTNADIADYIFVKQMDETTLMETDELVLQSGCWFQQLCDADGNELSECCFDNNDQDAYAMFQLFDFTFANDTLSFNARQNPNQLQPEDTYKVYLYVVNPTTKQYNRLMVNFNIEKNPIEEVTFKDMTQIGSQDFSCDQYPDNGYGYSSMNLDLEAIAEALGTTVDALEFRALANAENFSTESTANYGGEWFNESGYVCAWGASATMFIEPETTGDYSIWHIGQYPNAFEGGQSQTTPIFFVRAENNTYYRVNVTLNVITKPVTDLDECATVGTLAYEMQIIPSGEYQDDYMAKAIDVDINYVSSLLDTNTPNLYGEKYNAETERFEYSDEQQSMDGCEQGFWMDVCEYVVNKSSVGTWNSTIGNSYGIGWVSDGTFTFFQMPSQRAVGDTYTDNFYLVNLNTAKKIKVTITVSYVESRETVNIVGNSSIPVEAGDDDPLGTESEELLEEIYEKLGCDAAEFEMAGDIKAAKTNTTFVDKDNGFYDDTYMGFPFSKDGFVVDPNINPEDVAFYLGISDLGEIMAAVLDPNMLADGKTLTGRLAFDYGESRYILSVTLCADPTGIKTVVNGKQVGTSNIFNLAGQKVNSSYKGIVIENGKKVLK